MLAEFKEKTYEKYFGFELARLTTVTFSPDQCDEAFLGFDDAFFLPWELPRHQLLHISRHQSGNPRIGRSWQMCRAMLNRRHHRTPSRR